MKSPIKQRTVAEGGKVYNDWKQPGRREILKENLKDQREDHGKVKLGARFPILDSYVHKSMLDDFRHDTRKLEKFLNSSDGRAYRRTPKGKSRSRSYGGI